MTDTVTVKPCPFCGLQEDEQYRPSLRETRDAIHDYTIGYSILCPCCGIEMHEEYQDDLLALWNGGTCNDDDEMNAIADERADGPFVATALEPQTSAQAARVLRNIEPDDGFWRSCSGCHETIDGQETGWHPYSPIFKCHLGAGCRECGGLGAVWDDTDYEDMARAIAGGE